MTGVVLKFTLYKHKEGKFLGYSVPHVKFLHIYGGFKGRRAIGRMPLTLRCVPVWYSYTPVLRDHPESPGWHTDIPKVR